VQAENFNMKYWLKLTNTILLATFFSQFTDPIRLPEPSHVLEA
jgi:hypothetical protein